MEAKARLQQKSHGVRAVTFQPAVTKQARHHLHASLSYEFGHGSFLSCATSSKRYIPCRHTNYPAISPSPDSPDWPSQSHRQGNACSSGLSSLDSESESGVHVHHEKEATWGPMRSGLYRFLEITRFLAISDFLSHSFRSALLSAACFLMYAFIFATGTPALGLPSFSDPTSAPAMVLLTISLALSGVPCLVDAFVQVMRLNIDAHVLMALAGVGSFWLGAPLEGALLFVLFHMAHALEAKFVRAAHTSLTGLLDAVPATANVVVSGTDGNADWGSQKAIAVAEVPIGALVVVKPGEAVPLDGVVHEGQALVGQENVTGESLPVLKQPGSTIFSGGFVRDGAIVVRTTTAAANSTAARIVRVTAEALKQRAPVETALSRLTNHWSKIVILGTAAAFAGLLTCGVPLWGTRGAAYRALGVLTAAAPCGLLLAPLAFVCAVAVLSRHGIIVKGAHLFDSLKRVSFVALDKTGTISQGQLTCTSVQGVWGERSAGAEPLAAAAALSFRGRHPVCAAVLSQFAKSKKLQSSKLLWQQKAASGEGGGGSVAEVTNFATRAGAGMSGVMGRTAVAFGSVKYVQPLLSEQQEQALAIAVQKQGSNNVNSVLVQGPLALSGSEMPGKFVPTSAEQITLFTFSDIPKEDSRIGIKDLREIGLDLGIYTGDNQSSALAMAQRIGVPADRVYAGLSPEHKAALVSKLQESGECVLMVGDGINDAPALAKADVSVALAESMESATAGIANVVLLHSKGGDSRESTSSASIRRIAFLLQVATSVRYVVIQNLMIAFCSMFAGALPALGGLVPLWVAVLVHEGSTVLVALNSCRLLLKRQVAVATT